MIYSLKLLTISKRSEASLREKLEEKGYPANVIDNIVASLKDQKLIDDLSFAKSKVYWSQHANSFGKNRIRIELKRKGIKESVIQDALSTHDPEKERELCFETARLRWDKLKTIEIEKRRKRVYDFLARRGFGFEMCREALQELSKKHENI